MTTGWRVEVVALTPETLAFRPLGEAGTYTLPGCLAPYGEAVGIDLELTLALAGEMGPGVRRFLDGVKS